MVSMTIRGVPDATRDRLAARAATAGQSLQEYMRATLIEVAERRSPAEVLAEIREHARRSGSTITPDETVAVLRELRDRE